MQNRSFVIGGAGFIGSHLVDECLAHGRQVWVYDDFSTGKQAHLQNHPALTAIRGNILDVDELEAALISAAPDTVYHLAAIHHIPTCEKNPEQALRVNIEGTQCVLSASASLKTLNRIVFTSTGALYDPLNRGALKEDSSLRATDIYSTSKTACENLLRYHAAKTNQQIVVARLFNTVGRRETNSHLVPAIVDQLASGTRQVLLGNLTPRRDYIHVEDVAEALFTLGNAAINQSYDCFNVGSGIEYSVVEVAKYFEEAIDEAIEVISVAERRRKVDRPNQKADITHIKTKTTWEPKRTLQQALKEIWQEHLEAAEIHGDKEDANP